MGQLVAAGVFVLPVLGFGYQLHRQLVAAAVERATITEHIKGIDARLNTLETTIGKMDERVRHVERCVNGKL